MGGVGDQARSFTRILKNLEGRVLAARIVDTGDVIDIATDVVYREGIGFDPLRCRLALAQLEYTVGIKPGGVGSQSRALYIDFELAGGDDEIAVEDQP